MSLTTCTIFVQILLIEFKMQIEQSFTETIICSKTKNNAVVTTPCSVLFYRCKMHPVILSNSDTYTDHF